MPFFISFFTVVFLLDITTKIAIRHQLPLGADVRVLPFFSITHIQNTGIAFGLFPGRNWIFVLIGIVLSAVILWMALRSTQDSAVLKISLGLILAGAWGNLMDRIFLGHVTDFLDFFIGSHHWPAFNVADSAICIGAGLMIWKTLVKGKIPHVSNSH